MTVPYVFTLDEALDHFFDSDDCPNVDDVETAGLRLGRDAYPALVSSLWDYGMLSAETAAAVVPLAWTAVEFPNRALGEDEWRPLFDLAGYTVDGCPAARPTEPLTLHRGAVPDCQWGWSWTVDRALAEWFAARPFSRDLGRVYTHTFAPCHLLAEINNGRANEPQHIVDTRRARLLTNL